MAFAMKREKKMRKAALGVFAALCAMPSAVSAGDFGENCCADLEERIAELEATTAQKGNRKVSLTFSGWVGNQLTYWNDGFEKNAYVTGLGTALASRIRFVGEAAIRPGWTAGYVMHIELIDSDSLTTSQDRPVGPGLLSGVARSVQAYESYWFIKSDDLGKLSVGLQSPPSDNGVVLIDASGTLIPANWIISGAFSFKIRNNDGGFVMNGGVPLIWGSTGACYPGDCLGVPFEIVRYDSPVWGGLSFSGSWGEDDIWDIGFRYSGEHAGFNIGVAMFYGNDHDEFQGAALTDADYYQVGAYVQHVGTGIFGLVNYGKITDEARDQAGLNPDVWYLKGGIRRNWVSLGATVPYAEYMLSEEGVSQSSKFQLWGAGLVQEIDAAAMTTFIKYRQYSFSDEVLCANVCKDLDELSVGAVVLF